jgi:hypothetical protein
MPGFALSALCRAAVEEVWKLLFDPAQLPHWWAGIETVRKDARGDRQIQPCEALPPAAPIAPPRSDRV